MITRNIPGTDLDVSLLAFGNFTVGNNWWKEFTDDEAVALQNHAVDRGVTFFDTAPAYGNGKAESLMKPTIRYAGRDNVVISTKFGYDLVADPGEEGSHRERKQDFSEANIRRELEQSLTNMGIDCVDLYQAHNIKLEHFTEEMLGLMDKLISEGKIRAWGAALGPAIGWREEGHKSFLEHDAATVQTVFNLYEQDPGRELCEIAVKRGRGGVIARVPTNSGMLDEEFSSPDHKFPAHDHRKFRDKAWLVHGLQKNRMVKPMAQELGVSLRQFAFKWLAGQAGLVSIEPNLLEPEDVDEFVAAAEHPLLPDDLLGELSELYEEDFGLGDEAHPCDIKSSVAEGGAERSGYRAPVLA